MLPARTCHCIQGLIVRSGGSSLRSVHKIAWYPRFSSDILLRMLLKTAAILLPVVQMTLPFIISKIWAPQVVGLPRDQNKANFNKLRQIAKFGMIVYYKIVINNLILIYIKKRYKKNIFLNVALFLPFTFQIRPIIFVYS